MKVDLESQRRINKIRVQAVRKIEDFWSIILEKRENAEMEEKIKTMPKDCRDLYRKFINLRRQTRFMKENLTSLNI